MRRLLEKFLGAPAAEAPDEDARIRLATAVLLVEISRADFEEQPEEAEAIERLLSQHFSLDAAESEILVEQARTESDRSVSLHDYTRTLHDTLTEKEKAAVVELLWEVALADDELDKYEDYLLRKIAELLYVTHPELIRLKHRVLDRMQK